MTPRCPKCGLTRVVSGNGRRLFGGSVIHHTGRCAECGTVRWHVMASTQSDEPTRYLGECPPNCPYHGN
jgi:uncharacterized Zn finger protein